MLYVPHQHANKTEKCKVSHVGGKRHGPESKKIKELEKREQTKKEKKREKKGKKKKNCAFVFTHTHPWLSPHLVACEGVVAAAVVANDLLEMFLIGVLACRYRDEKCIEQKQKPR